jgi:hypothetical protein
MSEFWYTFKTVNVPSDFSTLTMRFWCWSDGGYSHLPPRERPLPKQMHVTWVANDINGKCNITVRGRGNEEVPQIRSEKHGNRPLDIVKYWPEYEAAQPVKPVNARKKWRKQIELAPPRLLHLF